MTIRITHFNAKNIRGIKDLLLYLDDNILVLGENGCGKSSIVDSIEYYFTGRVEKISGRRDIRENESLQFSGGGQLSVSLRFSEDEKYYSVGFPHTSPNIPERLTQLFEFASERSFILRRSQLLRFINAKPRERYDLVSDLIGLGDLDAIEDAWGNEVTQISKNIQSINREHLQIIESLTKLLDIDNISESQIINGINQKLSEFDIEPISKYADLKESKETALAKSANPENIRKAEQIRHLNRKMDNIQSKIKEELFTSYNYLYEAWKNFLSNAETANEADLEKLLTEGLQIISTIPLETCPLCEEPITDRQNLISRLEQRTNDLQAFTASRKAMETKTNIFSQIMNELSRILTEFETELSEVEITEQFNSINPEIIAKFNDWKLRLLKKPLDLITPDKFQQEEQINDIQRLLIENSTAFQEIIAKLTPSDEESRTLKLVEMLTQAEIHWKNWIEIDTKKRNAEQIHLQIKMIYDELVAAKIRGLDQILEQLETEFIGLYEYVHPSEGYEKISLILPSNRGKSIELEANKEGIEAMHPLGIFSEGHLDSLGLCIFLAFIKRFNEDFKLIVLDDILTSIDAGHRMRVALLLSKEFREYQIILTTHDEMWANEIISIFKNKGISLKGIFLSPWDQAMGVTYDDYVATDWDYYLKQARQGFSQDAIAGIGRKLEQFLLTMRRHFHLAVPATLDDRYTLGDLFPIFFKWIDNHKFDRPDIPDLWQKYEVLKEEFDAYWRLRNWSGAHYNDWGATVSITEAVQFIQIIRDIVQIFTCPTCGSLVIYDIHQRVVHCPRCQVTVQPKIVSVYNSQNIIQIERIVEPECKIPKKEKHIIRGSLSIYERFLQDSRRKLQLPVQATADDNYSCTQLHSIYIAFLLENHPKNFTDESEKIHNLDSIIQNLLGDVESSLGKGSIAEANEIFHAIQDLIVMGSCPECNEILSFDTQTKSYICAQCQNDNKTISLVANWRIL